MPMRIATLATVLLLAGCAGGGSQSLGEAMATPASLHDATGAAVFPGFTVLPPPGRRWTEQAFEVAPPASDGTQYRVAYYRRPPRDGLKIIALVITRPIPAAVRSGLTTAAARQDYLRALIASQQRAEHALGNAGRMRVRSSNYVMSNTSGYECYRHDSTTEDRGIPNSLGGTTTEAHTLACLSPDNSFVAEFGYSQAVPTDTASADMAAEGEAFLRGFRFTASTAAPTG
jgi:hypothetical protein